MKKPFLLDNVEEMHRIDKSDMLSFCADAPRHYGNAIRLATQFRIDIPKPENIIVAGMGGSAIGGDLLKDWAQDKVSVPIDVCRDYHLPAYSSRKTLVLCTSYSGETEETLNIFLEALKRKCSIVGLSSGGTLHKFAEKLNIPHVLVPSGMAPRATLPYLFLPLTKILEKIDLTSGVDKEYEDTQKTLRLVSAEYSPDIAFKNNKAKIFASEIAGTLPIVYGFRFYRAVAQRFKTQINENSKCMAKWEYFPELNHNETVAWEKAEEFAQWLSVIFIRDSEEPDEIRNRIEFMYEIVKKAKVKTLEAWSRGKSKLAKMSSVICLGDFTSVYLAILRGVDPTPVKTITVLKERLKKTGLKEKTVQELQKLSRS